MRTEAETRAVWPQAKGHPEPPRAGRHRKDPSLEPLREPTPLFSTSSFQTWENTFVVS